jgi:hypothetical protein
MKSFWGTVFLDTQGRPKQGHEYQTLRNMYNSPAIGIIIRWLDGKLHDDGELPAVEFQDTHIEHYRGGLLHNISVDKEGKLNPAIISGYGTQAEYFIDGKEVR